MNFVCELFCWWKNTLEQNSGRTSKGKTSWAKWIILLNQKRLVYRILCAFTLLIGPWILEKPCFDHYLWHCPLESRNMILLVRWKAHTTSGLSEKTLTVNHTSPWTSPFSACSPMSTLLTAQNCGFDKVDGISFPMDDNITSSCKMVSSVTGGAPVW